ncbi:MAG: esterase, partial [Muribaculaceae bacterium]|nr:esterase [Muribaculaceae bacterium]
MKKFILFLGLLVCVMTCNAQQALWGFSQIVSPEVNPDKTVTFRFNAPDAKKVQVTGDFLAPVPMDTPYGK